MRCEKWAMTLMAVCGAAFLLNGCIKPAPEPVSLAVLADGQGNIALVPPGEEHAPGTVVTITAMASPGTHFDHWTGGLTGSANPATVTLDADLSITAVFVPNSYTLAYSAAFGGGISGTTPQSVLYGGSGTSVTAVVGTGLHFVRWSDGSTDNPRTDANVTADISVYAEFAIDTFTLTYSAGEHGAITGKTLQTVEFGTGGVEVTAAPAEHCHFVQWSDGVTTASRTDTGVAADLSVTATFAVDTHTLTYVAGEHGSITGTTPQSVDYGTDGATVTAAPDTGYHFVQWSDGVITAARTDAHVTASLGVSASFALNIYALNYTAGVNGTLTGDTPQSVSHGGSGTAVTAVPNENCHFVQWSDGVTTATRTDTSVTGDITVTAEFGTGVVLHVDADSTAAAPDGVTWTTAYPDIQSAVDAAPVNAQVWVAEGTYRSTAAAVLNMRAAVLLYGGFAGTEVYRDQRDWNAHKSVIDGEDARRGVVGADYAALDGFTIMRGHADNGGGMYNTLASPVIARCVFAGNAATNGGGFGNFGGSPLIEDCVFQGNTSQDLGGGLYSDGGGGPVLKQCVFVQNTVPSAASLGYGGGIFFGGATLSLTDCLMAENSAVYGGGMVAASGTLTLTNSVFSGNSARYSGGAIAGVGCTATVDNCTFVQNSTEDGGALYTVGTEWTLNNCILRKNSATGEGGAIHNSSGNLNARNCTFTQNSARYGGALRSSYTEWLTNCILWGDTATADGPEIHSDNSSHSSVATYSCIEGGFAGTGNINADPLFVDAEDGSLYLRPGSPCLDTGTLTDTPATDMLGRVRPAGDGVDMGAYEGAATDLVTLALQASPAYGGSLWPTAGTHQYVRGERVLLAATPSGMRFTGWTGDVADNAAVISVVMDADKTVTAEFALNVVYVTPAGKGTEDGKSWATAFHEIQSAVDAAPADSSGEVWVAEGTYTSTADQVLSLRRGVLLYGGFAGNETSRDQRDWNAHKSVIDGENARRGVIGVDNAVLDGFTVTRGYTSLNGGGMFIENASPTVRNCIFACNAASFGGGAMGIDGLELVPVITDCTFLENDATQNGGAIYNLNASPQVRHCLFKCNSAASGGGTFEQGGHARMSDCTFLGNSAAVGGGMYSLSNGPSLARCAFVGNSATVGEGGGIFDDAGYGNGLVGENCLFLRNSAIGPRGYGGAVRPADGPSTKLTNCTFTQNAALQGGALGGDYMYSSYFPLSQITNCVLWDNIGIWDSPEIYAGSSEDWYLVTYCCIKGGYMGEGNIDADPLFVDGPGGSAQLREGSPCLDTGAAESTVIGMVAVAPATDMLSRPRPAGAGIDMGAYEGIVSANDLVTLTTQVSPAEGGHTQPEAGTHTFVRGETAWVTALPLGMRFTGWTGDATEEGQGLGLVMDADKTVTAEFVPNVLYVNAAKTGAADGRSWATAFSTIQQALNAATADPGGEVWVAEGYYMAPFETGIMLEPGVSLYGGFAGTETARDQRNWNAHLTVIVGPGQFASAVGGADDAVLDGFTITKGQSGMFIRNCSPRVANCLFVDNSGVEGGGISNEGGSPTIVNCTFKANKAGMYAGGMSNMGGAPIVTGCLFVENSGCGLYNGGSSATVTGCRFEKNSYGGMRNDFYSNTDCTVMVTSCAFLQNTAGSGISNFALMDGAGRLDVSNSVFLQNSGTDGGGILNYGIPATLANCTFTQNTVTGYDNNPGRGGGYYQEDTTTTMTNCIVWGNIAGEGPEIFVSTGTLTLQYSCAPPDFGGEGNFYLNPLFVNAANGNVRLMTGSPCIDTGTAVGAPSTDITGKPRPQGAGVDMGAYER